MPSDTVGFEFYAAFLAYQDGSFAHLADLAETAFASSSWIFRQT